MNKYMIETVDLTKQYGSQKALDHVSIHIAKGEIYGFVGRNGAGKTTFLKLLCSLIDKSSGEIRINGNTDLASEAGNIGALIEAPGIYPKLSAYRNLYLKCLLVGVKHPHKETKRVLEEIGLGRVGNKQSGAFSLGMRQRLGIGMAMIGDPEILLLDEPINGLDPQGIVEVRNLLLSLQKKGTTIIVSSHLLDELKRVANRFGIIESGKMVKEITNEELHDMARQCYKLRTNNNTKAIDVLKGLGYKEIEASNDYITVNDKNFESAKAVKQLVEKGIGVEEVFESKEDSENVFVRMMGGVTYA